MDGVVLMQGNSSQIGRPHNFVLVFLAHYLGQATEITLCNWFHPGHTWMVLVQLSNELALELT